MTSVLIVKLSSIGDVIHALPVACALKRRYPLARITWAVESWTAPLVAGHHAIDRVVVFPPMMTWPRHPAVWWSEMRAAARELRLEQYDVAVDQDALYDAEEYLRSELAENPQKSEAEVIASVAGSYGAPDEVADIYRDTEVKVQTALRPPQPRPRHSWFGRFFGVAAEPRTYSALFYMLLSLATGIFYFTWVVAGLSVSGGLAVTIVGIAFVILFGSVRVLSLVEGRIVEVMLGEGMPRRPLYSSRGKPMLERIKDLFIDPRTWSTQLYFVMMLPLGIAYFTAAVTLLAMALAFIAAPFAVWFADVAVDTSITGWQLINYDGVRATTSL